tara:strand:+ start:855 stop:1028 length:174 start_codon:yes stop_codon:yes gene_type:complete
MGLADFIDLFLTPIAGGVGAFLALRYTKIGPGFTPKVTLGIAVAVAVALFAVKVATR